jgi:asparagine N-glycosylation enzyme membrane subunit Stt3
MLSVWGSFILVGLIGLFIRKRKSITKIIVGTLSGSVLFFLITNFAVWFFGNWYEKTFSGLGQCFYLALPFFRSSLLGDIFYVGVFFGTYELVLYLNREKEKGLIKVKNE